jgi:hypothetical protein
MASLKVLRPHISADGAYRAVDEVYEESNAEYVAIRVEAGIVEIAKAKSKKKDEAEVPAGDVVVDAPAGETLIED